MKHHVIIGNGVAAVGCIEGIRSIDKTSAITVISAENHPVYGRPLISYYLQKKTDPEHMRYRDVNFCETHNVSVIYGKSAIKIDDVAKEIELSDHTRLSYFDACIATGSSAFIPQIEGLDTVEKRFCFMTLDDAMSIESAVNKDSRVLIIGAGLIGLKCAEGIKERVASVTVCDLADRILSSILDAECASMVQKHLEAEKISFYLNDGVIRFENNTAHLSSGSSIEFDVLIMAVGVRPNTSLVKELGGYVDRGIVVDNTMQTSISGIYAAGDCAQGYDLSSQEKRVLAILPNAYMQGHCAGINMAGGSDVFDKAIPMNSIGFF
ncbi:MAG: NAD(P)/FAD-dependent oxidoreductase, partial [Eggerthellaceae bacterium]|nr:NAD(P)/FAD-dependent oxidoreductase [Eggerthellaceae bacterium]